VTNDPEELARTREKDKDKKEQEGIKLDVVGNG
jgi:hypothetical protein